MILMTEKRKNDKRFCIDYDRILDSIGDDYLLCMIGNLNEWAGDRVRENVTGVFGVAGNNKNGKRVADFFAGKEM